MKAEAEVVQAIVDAAAQTAAGRAEALALTARAVAAEFERHGATEAVAHCSQPCTIGAWMGEQDVESSTGTAARGCLVGHEAPKLRRHVGGGERFAISPIVESECHVAEFAGEPARTMANVLGHARAFVAHQHSGPKIVARGCGHVADVSRTIEFVLDGLGGDVAHAANVAADME